MRNDAQLKTGRAVRFEVTEPSRQAIDDYLRQVTKRPGEFLFGGRRGGPGFAGAMRARNRRIAI
jgi:hypothetical protein